jgi:hypothetical protein
VWTKVGCWNIAAVLNSELLHGEESEETRELSTIYEETYPFVSLKIKKMFHGTFICLLITEKRVQLLYEQNVSCF